MPQISPAQLNERLSSGKPTPAVLLYGSDTYMRETCRTQLVDICVEPAARAWGVSRFSAADDELSQALGQSRTLPMLAPRQVVIVAELEALEQLEEQKRDAAVAELMAYLKDPAPFTILVLEASALDQRMKLAKQLFERVVAVQAQLPDDPAQRLQMAALLAAEMVRDRGAVIDADAAEDLADACNCDLALIRSEADKLATYAGPGQTIGIRDIELLVVSEKRHTVWELADLLASKERARAFAFLDNLLREGEQPPALVGAMAWMFRKLLEIQDLGSTVSHWQVASRLKMRSNTAETALRYARKIPRRQLLAGLRALYDADSQLKSGADDRAVMEFLLARLMNAGTAAA